MILVQREAKVPADFKLGPIEPLVRRPGGSRRRGTALMPRIEAAAGRLLNLINCNRMVPHPTYNLLIGQATRPASSGFPTSEAPLLPMLLSLWPTAAAVGARPKRPPSHCGEWLVLGLVSAWT
jgi:hypothetical protein